MSAVVVIAVRQQKRAIRAFKNAGATSPTTTQRLEDLRIRRSLPIRALIRHDVLVETSEGRFYLDTARAEAHARARRIRAIVLVSISLVAIALILIFK